jgi:hypothetical protein
MGVIRRCYWRFRHWRWNRGEDRFVREVVRRLGDKDRLYVHPQNGGPATILIAPYDPLPDYNHAHVEGRERYVPGSWKPSRPTTGGQ